MQRAIGQIKAPHPELEAELRAEYAKIEPKVEQGTVTKAEADHLHSLEARAHGHTERGGLAAKSQSVAAKRERALSLSNKTRDFRSAAPLVMAVEEAELEMAKQKVEKQKVETKSVGLSLV